jgi:hypothetical protein
MAAAVGHAVGLWPDASKRGDDVPVQALALAGPLAEARAEVSGLAWYGDRLVLLPQFPERVGGTLFTLAKNDILAYLEGRHPEPLAPVPLPFHDGGLSRDLEGFEGFEALAFRGDEAFLTVEADQHGRTVGYLYRARVTEGPALQVDPKVSSFLAPQTDVPNLAYEALTVADGRLLALYEANGRINGHPFAQLLDSVQGRARRLAVTPVEYRITDLTATDRSGRFWAVNYFWSGADWKPGPSMLHERFGLGATHRSGGTVERLIELKVGADEIRPTGRPPLRLRLRRDGAARNWEGIAKLDDRGFLLVSDEHPSSLFGFVAGP